MKYTILAALLLSACATTKPAPKFHDIDCKAVDSRTYFV